MNSLSRLEGQNIRWGKSYVIGTDLEIAKKEKAKSEAEKIIEEAKNEAKKIIEKANIEKKEILDKAKNESIKIQEESELLKKEAEELVEKAKSEASTIRAEAKSEGILEGKKEGEEIARQELEEKVLLVDNFTKNTFEIKKKIIKNAHVHLIDIISKTLTKIGLQSMADNNEFLENSLINGINSLPEKETVKILINPSLAEKIYELTPTIKEKILMLENIKIVEDASMNTDGAIIEGIHARVDASLSAQIEEVTTDLSNHLNSIQEAELVEITEQELSNEDT